jgi:uncharacterized membrane protein HdeD (DUF308 family)
MVTHQDSTMFTFTAADDDMFRRWWARLGLVGGAVSIVVALILMVWPSETLVVLAVLLGIWLIIAGVANLAQAIFAPEDRTGGLRALKAIGGVIFLIAGVFCVRHAFTTVTFVAALIGITWLVTGVLEVFSAFGAGVSGWYRGSAFALGILSILAALVVLIWPEPSLVAMVWLAGIWLLILGIAQIVAAIRALRAPVAAA